MWGRCLKGCWHAKAMLLCSTPCCPGMSPCLSEVPTDMNSSLQHVDVLSQKGLEARVHRAVSGNNAQMSKLCQLEFFLMESMCQQSVFCCLKLQKSPHSRKLGTEEETKGGSVCALRSLLPTKPSFPDSISGANCSVSVLTLEHFCGQPSRVRAATAAITGTCRHSSALTL